MTFEQIKKDVFFLLASYDIDFSYVGREDKKEELLKVIADHKDDRGALMPVLQKAQDIYGYLPIEVQTIISEEMNIPLEKVYGVVTFYSQFSLNPKGKYKISVCLGTACYVKGSGDILEKIKEIEERHHCTVYAVTHELMEFGECYDFLIVTDYVEEWDELVCEEYRKIIMDSNMDEEINIKDATFIQKKLANLK